MPKIYTDWYQSASGNWYNKKVCQGLAAHYKAICDLCGVEYFARKHKAKGIKGGSGRLFCSKSCSSKATVREQNLDHLKTYCFKKGHVAHNFKGGYCMPDGRKIVTINGKKVLEYRKLVEQFLGRPLRNDEVVHHINGDVTDNRIENLRLMSQSSHVKLHWEEGSYENRNNKEVKYGITG